MLGRPVMISENPVTPKPQAIDDRYLIADASICEQPPHKFSRASWFVETLKLHDILRKILSTLYDNAKLVEDERTNDQKKSKKTPEIQSIIEIDADLQNFKANLPTPLKWDLSQLSDDLLRERLLLKARCVVANPLFIDFDSITNHSLTSQIFLPSNLALQADTLPNASREQKSE
jgi:hypothetical protein